MTRVQKVILLQMIKYHQIKQKLVLKLQRRKNQRLTLKRKLKMTNLKWVLATWKSKKKLQKSWWQTQKLLKQSQSICRLKIDLTQSKTLLITCKDDSGSTKQRKSLMNLQIRKFWQQKTTVRLKSISLIKTSFLRLQMKILQF